MMKMERSDSISFSSPISSPSISVRMRAEMDSPSSPAGAAPPAELSAPSPIAGPAAGVAAAVSGSSASSSAAISSIVSMGMPSPSTITTNNEDVPSIDTLKAINEQRSSESDSTTAELDSPLPNSILPHRLSASAISGMDGMLRPMHTSLMLPTPASGKNPSGVPIRIAPYVARPGSLSGPSSIVQGTATGNMGGRGSVFVGIPMSRQASSQHLALTSSGPSPANPLHPIPKNFPQGQTYTPVLITAPSNSSNNKTIITGQQTHPSHSHTPLPPMSIPGGGLTSSGGASMHGPRDRPNSPAPPGLSMANQRRDQQVPASPGGSAQPYLIIDPSYDHTKMRMYNTYNEAVSKANSPPPMESLHKPPSPTNSSSASKRNKFFYKELREHLESSSRPSIGFLNDNFFVMDPKLHVGPINRDGTFEKRVRLHFIEWLELKHVALWLCWGTLLDTSRQPVFRESNTIYRIPGNQSSLFKTNRSFQGWNVADDDQKRLFRSQGLVLKWELEAKWDGFSVETARRIVAPLSLPESANGNLAAQSSTAGSKPTSSSQLNISPSPSFSYSPSGSFSSAPRQKTSPTHDAADAKRWSVSSAEGTSKSKASRNSSVDVFFIDDAPSPAPATPASAPSSFSSAASRLPEDIAADLWKELGCGGKDIVAFDQPFREAMITVYNLTTFKDELLSVFKLLAAEGDKISFEQFKLTIKRYGSGQTMFQKMVDLLATDAFNGEMSTEEAEDELMRKDVGSYLIRYSQSTPEHFCICWRWKDKIEQMNQISNNPSRGINVDVGAEVLQFSSWKAFVDAAEIMQNPIISPRRVQYHSSSHQIPLSLVAQDERYAAPKPRSSSASSASPLPTTAGGLMPSHRDQEDDVMDADGGSREDSHNKVHDDGGEDGEEEEGEEQDSMSDEFSSLEGGSTHSGKKESAITVPNKPIPSIQDATLPPVPPAVPSFASTNTKTSKDQQLLLLQYIGQLMAQGKLDTQRFSRWAVFLSSAENASQLAQVYMLYEVYQHQPDLWISSVSTLIPNA